MLRLARRLPNYVRFTIDDRRFRKIYQKYKNFTMVPADIYVDNLCLTSRIGEISGSVVECGTWRGGMMAGMADVLGADRRYLLFDSFQGLPPAREIDGAAALAWQSNKASPIYFNNCAASEEEVTSVMSMSAARNYQIIKGWFNETLPKVNLLEPIALLRLDADWYESTKCILDNLASHVAPGGMVIVDDYHTWEGCTLAINEFAVTRKWRIRQSRRGVCFIIA